MDYIICYAAVRRNLIILPQARELEIYGAR